MTRKIKYSETECSSTSPSQRPHLRPVLSTEVLADLLFTQGAAPVDIRHFENPQIWRSGRHQGPDLGDQNGAKKRVQEVHGSDNTSCNIEKFCQKLLHKENILQKNIKTLVEKLWNYMCNMYASASFSSGHLRVVWLVLSPGANPYSRLPDFLPSHWSSPVWPVGPLPKGHWYRTPPVGHKKAGPKSDLNRSSSSHPVLDALFLEFIRVSWILHLSFCPKIVCRTFRWTTVSFETSLQIATWFLRCSVLFWVMQTFDVSVVYASTRCKLQEMFFGDLARSVFGLQFEEGLDNPCHAREKE